MTNTEQAIMKKVERIVGYLPNGSLDLLRVFTHPDVIDLTKKYLDEKLVGY